MEEVPIEGSNSEAVSKWLETFPGTRREKYRLAQEVITARRSKVAPDSEEWRHWSTVQLAIGELMRIDRKPFIGQLLESAHQ